MVFYVFYLSFSSVDVRFQKYLSACIQGFLEAFRCKRFEEDLKKKHTKGYLWYLSKLEATMKVLKAIGQFIAYLFTPQKTDKNRYDTNR